ncbi:hypothetical protein MC885_016643 [Smutsia gigantea]|nr:hypothetical protein MC885_016643 [Smutsia gigantea]
MVCMVSRYLQLSSDSFPGSVPLTGSSWAVSGLEQQNPEDHQDHTGHAHADEIPRRVILGVGG